MNYTPEFYETKYGNVLIDVSKPNIIVKVSGGFDSAVILYAIASAISKHKMSSVIYPMTLRMIGNHAGIPKLDKVNTVAFANQVIAWVRSQFPDVTIKDTIQCNLENWWISEQVTKDFFKDNLRTLLGTLAPHSAILYTGDTKNPDFVIGQQYFEEDGVMVHRNAEPIREVLHVDAVPSSISALSSLELYDELHPFRNFDKRAVFSFAARYSNLDKLLEITRSCEGRRGRTRNFTATCMTTDVVSNDDTWCCWWCHEREWALNNYEK